MISDEGGGLRSAHCDQNKCEQVCVPIREFTRNRLFVTINFSLFSVHSIFIPFEVPAFLISKS
uniref:Uncharacterized protein n=1 Tax=Parascaris univalens TaxID=6257 RepID=A0A915CHS5_PARUN